MATKKTPVPKETDAAEQLLEQPAEEPQQENANDARVKAQQAEIERLKAQLAQAQKARPMSRNDAEVVRKAAQEAADAGIDPWSITVNIRAPRRRGNDDPWYWLTVNGMSVQIPADDKFYDIKLPWAEALINSLDADRKATDFQDSLEVYDPVTNPHRE